MDENNAPTRRLVMILILRALREHSEEAKADLHELRNRLIADIDQGISELQVGDPPLLAVTDQRVELTHGGWTVSGGFRPVDNPPSGDND